MTHGTKFTKHCPLVADEFTDKQEARGPHCSPKQWFLPRKKTK